MASTPRKRTDGSWNSQVRVQGYPPVSVTAPTKRECSMRAAEKEREIRTGEVNSDSRATFGQLLDMYLSTDEHKRRKTAAKLEAVLGQWRERFGRARIGEVRTAMIADARDEMLRGGLSSETVRKAINTLSGFLRWCMIERQAVKVNACSAVKKPAEGKARSRYLSTVERDRLFAACKEQSRTPSLYPLVVLGCFTGMRRGEMLALRWDDVDLERGWALIRESKNGESRTVPVMGPALVALKEWSDRVEREGTRENSGLVFQSRWFPIEAWERAREQAGVEDFRFHDLRHTMGSALVQSGADIASIAEILGHKTLKMARRYSHHSPASREAIVDRMLKAFA